MKHDISMAKTDEESTPLSIRLRTVSTVELVMKHVEYSPKIHLITHRGDSKKEYLDQALNINKMYSLALEFCSMQNPPANSISSAV